MDQDSTKKLHTIWKHACKTYDAGNMNVSEYFSEEQIGYLQSIGMTAQEMFDYAEDFVRHGEPDFICMALIQDIRKKYFLDVMHGKHSEIKLDMESLPAKTEELHGIEWLPRIIPKAHAKLRGEMPDELMYCCGGDRRFFKENNIHPAEFLREVWFRGDDKEAIATWVTIRRKHSQGLVNEIKKLFS